MIKDKKMTATEVLCRREGGFKRAQAITGKSLDEFQRKFTDRFLLGLRKRREK